MTGCQPLPDKLPETRHPPVVEQGRLELLYLSQYFHPEQFLNNHIAKALAADGHHVDVVCCVPNYPSGRFFPGYSNRRRKEEIWHGVRVHRVFTIPRGRNPAQLLLNYLVYPVSASWRILRLKKQRRHRVSFVSMPSPLFQAFAGVFAKRIWKVPTVFWVQDLWPDSAIITLRIRNRLVIGVLNSICGWLYRQADLIMVQSDGFHGRIAHFGVDPDKIVTLPNCAPEHFAPVEPSDIPERVRSLIPHDRRVIMFAGNIGESQDFDTVIEAVELLPQKNKLLIAVVGSGRDEDRVKALVEQKDLQDRFLFLGRHPEADMPLFFACADAMLVSLRDEPIFALTVPSKVQSYLACGKPILASLAGEGGAIIAEAGAGIVVAPSSPEALSRGLAHFSQTSRSDLAEMSIHAQRAYESKFSLPSVVTKLTRHLQALQIGARLDTASNSATHRR